MNKKRITLNDLKFVECLFVMAKYELRKSPSSNIKFTDRQIKDLLWFRCGIDLQGDSQTIQKHFRRFKNKFISKKDRPATHVELLKLVESGARMNGKQGRASIYCLTGLASAFPQMAIN